MPILQAPPTCAPVTHRVAALARGDGESRLSVPLASAGPQPGDLKRTVVEAIRVRHYSRRTEQAYWHWTRQFVLWSGKRHPLEMGAPEVSAFLSHLATERDVSASVLRGHGDTAPDMISASRCVAHCCTADFVGAVWLSLMPRRSTSARQPPLTRLMYATPSPCAARDRSRDWRGRPVRCGGILCDAVRWRRR